jgi:hypothetical protein
MGEARRRSQASGYPRRDEWLSAVLRMQDNAQSVWRVVLYRRDEIETLIGELMECDADAWRFMQAARELIERVRACAEPDPRISPLCMLWSGARHREPSAKAHHSHRPRERADLSGGRCARAQSSDAGGLQTQQSADDVTA